MLLTFASCHIVSMTSVIINPILYGFLNDNFQKVKLNIAKLIDMKLEFIQSLQTFAVLIIEKVGLMSTRVRLFFCKIHKKFRQNDDIIINEIEMV